MTSRYFHFTLGPVQGFVAQARRTRDFWAGSFLLSWLAGVAMSEVSRQGGKIEFPSPPTGYLDWIQGQGQGQPPRQGAIPNRFKSVWARVPADFDAPRVVETVRAAWMALAEQVWQGDRLDEVATAATRDIWLRQHSGFWDMSWVLSDDVAATALLDQRKNWRSHGFAQQESGIKCMVMEGWQELSGATRAGQAASSFWQRLWERPLPGLQTDLREGEKLCALAYVKRRFTRHFERLQIELPDGGLKLKGWRLSPGMPSVSYMAAVHWLEALLKTGDTPALEKLLRTALDVCDDQSEWDTHIECLRQAVPQWQGPQRHLLALDGSLFFRHVQQDPMAAGHDPARMARLVEALRDFRREHPHLPAAPSPFYAIVLMDGDSLGSHMSDLKKQKTISESLLQFTDGVPEIVQRHNGVLIYAGGDDVLALLPLEDALGCAARIRAHYLACFQGTGIATTISAAVTFAHVKTPLGQVLADLHPLLDEVAKDGAGRDALAVQVWKTGGGVLQWAQPWKIALKEGQPDGELEIEMLARDFASDAATGKSGRSDEDGSDRYSGKFFFKIEERLAVLDPAAHRGRAPVQAAAPLDHEALTDLLAVDYWHSASNRRHLTLEQARTRIAPLLRQCRPHVRHFGNGKETDPRNWLKADAALRPDAALLVSFLATKGLEGDNQ
ncbi:type III-B CRISPR-associated protein Cas10/Cmr2 [Sphaerotilus uruguayifluvii]|uniref:CRISPR-associated protein Cmr2 n=1 Tax=Sphaerotilus uruguayifluvii TaxID=2735897 RepID=A0ABX2G8J2_9BURK|nr:CRISPR-associated protein Cmr2 [Leptothrix sp. C29]